MSRKSKLGSISCALALGLMATATAQAAQPQITPAPFFGTQGGGSTAGNGGNLIVPSAPSLGGVGSGPIMRSGGS